MKFQPPPQEPQGLNLRQLRALEAKLGVYLTAPKTPDGTVSQQFGLFDEDEKYVCDIRAPTRYFTLSTLVTAIHAALRIPQPDGAEMKVLERIVS